MQDQDRQRVGTPLFAPLKYEHWLVVHQVIGSLVDGGEHGSIDRRYAVPRWSARPDLHVWDRVEISKSVSHVEATAFRKSVGSSSSSLRSDPMG